MEGPTGASSLRDHSPLSDRPEWLSPRDLQEVFGIGRTKSFNICKELPHIYIGRCIRVHKSTIVNELRERRAGCHELSSVVFDLMVVKLIG